ncbi:DUF445 domain-containing protein [Rheinheimera salexigens]|uniref:DUF445 domain-containing protein n=1 Tax=Rheinheimera salexigens TaxID=1628148 RepID=A0A1E7QA74_9GAMM|nr:DUF445 domain-containing protein [Rheinheimera salexigens]
MNKSIVTNLLALIVLMVGWYWQQPIILSVGLFALSGALTNWLAVHMLFEKVPLLYGSGVILLRFEQFKAGIQQLVMQQFFSAENIQRFMQQQQQEHATPIDLQPVIEQADLSPAFDSLVNVVEQSSFGSMLGMFGGTEALMPLKQPFIDKLKAALTDIAHSDDFNQLVMAQLNKPEQTQGLQLQVQSIVEKRLQELTPELVKDIIQNIIRQHLGWLVVWGGVFGGLIGLIAALIQG